MTNELKNQRINEKFCLSIKGGKGRQTDLRMEGIFCGSSVHALLVFELLVQVSKALTYFMKESTHLCEFGTAVA